MNMKGLHKDVDKKYLGLLKTCNLNKAWLIELHDTQKKKKKVQLENKFCIPQTHQNT